MRISIINYKLLFFFLLMGPFAFSQTAGELENVEIEIVKERKISLPQAERKFSKIPPQASEPISPPITYSFKPIEVQLPLVNLSVRPLKLKKEENDDIKRGQISVGYGNFAAPYLEAFVTSKEQSKKLIGAHALVDVWAKGPVDKRNSGNGRYGLSLFANSYGNDLKAGAYVSYDQLYWHFYGYNPGAVIEAEDIFQQFTRFALGGNLANASVKKMSYNLSGAFNYLQDNFDAKESDVAFDFTSRYQFADVNHAKINASYQLLSREDQLVNIKPRSLFQLSSQYSFQPIENLIIDAGFGIALENDTIDKNFHFYPKVNANYALSERVTAKAFLSGQMQSVSLHSLTNENPWLAPNVAIAHTNEALLLGGSIETALGKNVKVEAGASVASFKNLYFYRNASSDQSRFVLQYDKGATERVNFYGMINYAVAHQTNANLKLDWFGYATDTLAAAWHRPKYQIEANVSHNFYKKLKVSGSFVVLGGMKAYDEPTNSVVTLSTAIDLSLRFDYYLSERVLLFLQGNNLLASDYQRYFHYPVRGLQVRAGFSWNF